jgi:hypothetical protein
MARISAPLFAFGDSELVETTDEYLRTHALGHELAMTGASTRPDGRTIPVRGDLAHIRLAGVHFVPHYAVPMPHIAGPQGARLRIAEGDEAELLATLEPGATYDVLDIAGGWAWGEVPGGKGPVGYVALSEIEASAT